MCHLTDTVMGASKHFCTSRFSKHVSFMLDFNSIAMSSFPHLNTYGLIGTSHKEEYVIWWETKGYFTALNRYGNLLTWSLGTGNLILTENVKSVSNLNDKTTYYLYRGDIKDDTYLKNNYNFEDQSVSLLVGDKLFLKQMAKGMSHETEVKLDELENKLYRKTTIYRKSDIQATNIDFIKTDYNVDLIEKS